MSKKILINALTMEGANLTPMILKAQQWRSLGCAVAFIGSEGVRSRVENISGKGVYDFIVLFPDVRYRSFLHYMYEGFKRNIRMICSVQSICGKFDVMYTVSSVLDLVMFPWVLKLFDKKIKWCTVFDNTVPFHQSGNIFKRSLAWIFFKISLVLLKKADSVFAISNELRGFLMKHGFDPNKVIITGNGIEKDLIDASSADKLFNIDILYVGRINESKGIYDILNVLRLLKGEKQDVRLAMMGAGDRQAEVDFQKRVMDFDLGNNIQMLGFKSGIEKFSIMKSSKCFISLSPNESYGVALCEAVACGIKSFVYDLSVYHEIYKEGEVQMFRVGDVAAVASAIAVFLRDFSSQRFLKSSSSGVLYTWGDIARFELKVM